MSMRVPAARTIACRTRQVSRGEYDGNRKRQATTNACAFARFGSSLIDRPLFSVESDERVYCLSKAEASRERRI